MSSSEYNRTYHLLHKDRINERRRLYRIANKVKCKTQRKKYDKKRYVKNRDKLLAYQRSYLEQNRTKRIAYRKRYYIKNKGSIIKKVYKYKVDRMKIDPLFRFKNRLNTLIRISITKYGYTKKSKTQKILGCSFDEFKQYMESKFKSGMTWSNHGEWHIDHIIPVALANTEEAAIKLNHYSNLQPLWAVENLEKNSKISLQYNNVAV
jgi:hypothetical protein